MRRRIERRTHAELVSRSLVGEEDEGRGFSVPLSLSTSMSETADDGNGEEEEDEEEEEDDPSIAFRVISSARGKSLTRKGASGAARRLAKMEPTVVSAVRRSVANMGEKSAPARTFYIKGGKTEKC